MIRCLIVVTLLSCQGATPTESVMPEGTSDNSAVVARVGDEVLRRAQLPPGSVDAQRSFVARWTRESLLFQAATQATAPSDVAPTPARRFLVDQAIARAVLARRIPDAQPSEAQITEFFNAHRRDFTVPERRITVHLHVPLAANVTADQRAQAWSWCEGVLQRAKASTTPREELAGAAAQTVPAGLVAQFGSVPAFAADGDSENSIVDAAFARAAFSRGEVGLVDRVVQTPFGLHIVYVDAVLPSSEPSLDERRPQIARVLRARAQHDAFEALLPNARVEKFDDVITDMTRRPLETLVDFDTR